MNLDRTRAGYSALRGGLVEATRGFFAAYPRAATLVTLATAFVLGLGGGYAVAGSPVAVSGGLLAILALLAIVQQPQAGLYLAVAVITLVPFGVAPLPLGGFQVTFLELALGLTLALWLLRSLLAPDQQIVVTPVGLLLVVFIAITAVAFANGTNYGFSAADLRQYAKAVLAMAAFFLVLNCLRDARDHRRLLAVLVGGGAIAAILGIAIFLLPREQALAVLNGLGPLGYPTGPGLLRFHVESERLRAVGTSIDPNSFGALLMTVGVLTLALALTPQPVIRRRWLVLALAPLVVGLLFSLSRSSWVGAVAGVCFILALRYKWFWPLLLLGAVAAVAVYVFALEVYLQRVPVLGPYIGHLFTGLRAGDQATLMRLGEYKDAFRLISIYPVLGVGYGAAPSVDLYVGVSSLYLLLAENAGLLGLGAYILAVAGIFVYTLRAAWPRRGAGTAWAAIGALGALVGALTAGVFDHPFINPRFAHLVALFWLFAGLAVWAAGSLGQGAEGQE